MADSVRDLKLKSFRAFAKKSWLTTKKKPSYQVKNICAVVAYLIYKRTDGVKVLVDDFEFTKKLLVQKKFLQDLKNPDLESTYTNQINELREFTNRKWAQTMSLKGLEKQSPTISKVWTCLQHLF